MFYLTPQHKDDSAVISALLDRAFGADRKQKNSYAYRQGLAPTHGLSFVAREHGTIVGTIRYWPLLIEASAGQVAALLLGPVAVEPARQGDGIGVELIRHTLRLATRDGHRLVLLVGDADYYGRFGFAPAGQHHITMDGEPERLMVRGLVPGALEGVDGHVVSWRCLRPGAGAFLAA